MRLQSLITGCPAKGAEALCIRHVADGSLSFDTYFNIFACALWKKYTTAEGFVLRVFCRGAGKLRVVADGKVICSAEARIGENVMPFDPGEAQAVWLEAGAGADVQGGEFIAEEADLRDVDIALDICTYRREEYVRRNIDLIRKEIWENPESPLNGHLAVYISDNAATLGDIPGARVFINRNVGGSGGFARGLMEIIDDSRATHTVFMDDDVTLMPESLERLYAFLRAVRDKYATVPVGGAMLRLDRPCIQHESLAIWHGLLSESLGTELDLSARENVIKNLHQQSADYSAWWFSCVPVSLAREKGLPLPIFVRMDDVEYGMRLGIPPMALPGVCVWHEPFERKHSAGTEYYHARNSLIVNALRTPQVPVARLLGRLIAGTLMRYRYVHAEMILSGVYDFLKGPGYLMNLDPQKCNGSLKKLEIMPAEDLDLAALEASDAMRDTRGSKIISMLTLNGAILPARGRAWVHAHINPVRAYFRKAEAINVIADTGLAFTVKRDNRRGLNLALRALKTLGRLRREWAVISEKWRAAEDEMVSREFWRKYLEPGEKTGVQN